MMTIQRTIDIPKATNHLTVELPRTIPAGTVDIVLFFQTSTDGLEPKRTKPGLSKKEAHAKLLGMFEGSTYTVDKLLDERQAETIREEEKFKMLFRKK